MHEHPNVSRKISAMTAQELAKAMMEMTFTKDETIFEQGAPWSMWRKNPDRTDQKFRMGNQ